MLHLPGSSALLYILGILHTEITNCLICDTHSFVVPLFWRAREELGHSTKIYLKDRTAQILRIHLNRERFSVFYGNIAQCPELPFALNGADVKALYSKALPLKGSWGKSRTKIAGERQSRIHARTFLVVRV